MVEWFTVVVHDNLDSQYMYSTVYYLIANSVHGHYLEVIFVYSYIIIIMHAVAYLLMHFCFSVLFIHCTLLLTES